MLNYDQYEVAEEDSQAEAQGENQGPGEQIPPKFAQGDEEAALDGSPSGPPRSSGPSRVPSVNVYATGSAEHDSTEESEAPEEEPWFPDLEDATLANQQALARDGQTNHALLRPDVLEGALGRAQNYWYYEQNLPKAAAALGHGVGMAQAFEDGNKRTAYHLTRSFLHENGLDQLSPIDDFDDDELADHLIGHAQGTHSMEDTAALLEQRAGQQRQANILDPVHDGLDPSVWDDPLSAEPTLRAEHSGFIFEHVYNTLEKYGYDGMEKWLSLVFTGSLTTYQYSEDSDADISVWVNAAVFPEWSRAEMIGIMVHELDGTNLPGTTHPLQHFVVASTRFTKEDLYKPGLRSGYDMNADSWITPPDRSRVHDVEKEMNEAYTIALENADKMEKLLRYEPDKAVMFWHQIHKRRMRDMNKGKGDYSPSNLTYKMLNNRGLYPQLEQASGEHIATLT